MVWLTCDKLTDLYDGDAEMEELLMRCWKLAAMIKSLKSAAATDRQHRVFFGDNVSVVRRHRQCQWVRPQALWLFKKKVDNG